MEINDISIAISRKLQEVFGSGYKKYTDQIPQGFQTPCFFIQFLNFEHIRQIGNRWKVTPLFNVQYFPQKGASESANMTLKVQRALKDVTLLNGAKMLARGANSEVVDGIGHNFMRFDFFLQEIEAKVLMGSFDHYTNGERVSSVGERD
ncbi:hypothetical protein LZ480_07725 [Solibacillus sp. MA9]|uniref:Uncharacterized protein n=1 Tax=Solibacillus palustris TaxID=2908203 RepID=A0ABS9UBQ3_9BACL|nr:hypothetical protein [Solibacillus sp. MA9]MCH7321781.1 hypothetical protein [Solibacillus sp. MA9]